VLLELNQTNVNKPRLNLTDQFRLRFKGILDPIAAFFNRLGFMPNTMTILGLVGNIIGAVFISQGQFVVGGIMILVMGPVGALDGTMARLLGMAGKFGAFVDSVTDRYSELVIFAGMMYYYVIHAETLAAMLVFFAAAGSVLVSYIRSRGQSLGWDTKVGILTRMERYLVLAPALVLYFISPLITLIGVAIIAVLANVTAIQRILDIRRQAYNDQTK